jgi:hypothetical protein
VVKVRSESECIQPCPHLTWPQAAVGHVDSIPGQISIQFWGRCLSLPYLLSPDGPTIIENTISMRAHPHLGERKREKEATIELTTNNALKLQMPIITQFYGEAGWGLLMRKLCIVITNYFIP